VIRNHDMEALRCAISTRLDVCAIVIAGLVQAGQGIGEIFER